MKSSNLEIQLVYMHLQKAFRCSTIVNHGRHIHRSSTQQLRTITILKRQRSSLIRMRIHNSLSIGARSATCMSSSSRPQSKTHIFKTQYLRRLALKLDFIRAKVTNRRRALHFKIKLIYFTKRVRKNRNLLK